jgi:hypothetical protein
MLHLEENTAQDPKVAENFDQSDVKNDSPHL